MRTLTQVVVSAALALASSAVLAQPSVPTQPAAGPTPDPDTGNGGIIVSAYDLTQGRQVSIVEYVGLKMNDLLPNSAGGNATPDGGLVLDFGTIQGWSTVFGSDPAANANIRYSVAAFDHTLTDPVNGTYTGMRMITTLASPATSFRNTALESSILKAGTFTASGLNGNTSGGCNGGNPCQALTNGEADYAGQTNWGDKFGGSLPQNASGAVNTQLGFYLFAANSDDSGSDPAPGTRYANSNGNAFWLLTDTGHLTYVVPGGGAVPLPAAVWLLLSGLASFGVIGRGRRGGVPAAA